MSRVSIVIVTHNSADAIEECLDALTAFEVIVIDNASTDSTCENVARHRVTLLRNENNAGFAAAVNQGVRATDSPLILLLNPDVVLESAINPLMTAFDDPGIGAATGLLKDTDGLPQTGFAIRNLPSPLALIFEVLGINRLWPRNPVNWHYRCLSNPLTMTQIVEQPAAAFLMFSRDGWNRLGGFDEGFWPVWFEDVDFLARLKRTGLLCVFVPNVTAKHEGGHSIRTVSKEIKEKYWYGNLLRYAEKHYPSATYRMICAAVVAGSVMRGLIGIPREGQSSWITFRSVRQLAWHRFVAGKQL